jgi:hypothetical protein
MVCSDLPKPVIEYSILAQFGYSGSLSPNFCPNSGASSEMSVDGLIYYRNFSFLHQID